MAASPLTPTNPCYQAVDGTRHQAEVIADGEPLHALVNSLERLLDVVLHGESGIDPALPRFANDRGDSLVQGGVRRLRREPYRARQVAGAEVDGVQPWHRQDLVQVLHRLAMLDLDGHQDIAIRLLDHRGAANPAVARRAAWSPAADAVGRIATRLHRLPRLGRAAHHRRDDSGGA